jgi:DNA (cytosine-5)-methyltransferase 1
MKHGSLFSGIGGFDLAAEWMGWENVFHCEINPFGQKILKYYWPNSISYDDITKTDFTIHRGGIDILTGGFPCQPFSQAGKRKGTEDERHLWPEMLRAIREIQPAWVVGENVFGITNWNGGLVFEQVQVDLEVEGYEVQAYILPACGVNAPHRRDRVWFVAHANDGRFVGQKFHETQSKWDKQIIETGTTSNSNRDRYELRELGENRSKEEESISEQKEWQRIRPDDRRIGEQGTVTDTQETECQPTVRTRERRKGFTNNNSQPVTDNCRNDERLLCGSESKQGFKTHAFDSDISGYGNASDTVATGKWRDEWKEKSKRNIWEQFPTQFPVCSRNDGISPELVGITISKHRNESIKAYGNAVCPELVLQIFKSIQLHENI